MSVHATQTWVLGGKNIDEDPLFSEYYLLDSAKAYGSVRAFYDGTVEAYYIPADAADRLAQQYLDTLIANPEWMRQNLAATEKVLNDIEAFVDKHPVETIHMMQLPALARLYRQQQRLTQKLYTLSRIPQALDRGSDLLTSYMIARLRPHADRQVFLDFALLSSPSGISRFEQAELYENEIANQFISLPSRPSVPVRMLASNEQIQVVKDLAQRYGHIAYHGYGNRTILGVNDFWARVQQKVTAGKELPTIASTAQKRAKLQADQQKKAQAYGLDDSFCELFGIYGAISLAKINRRFTQIKNFVVLDALIMRLSELSGIPEIALRFMTQAELRTILNDEPAVDLLDVTTRIPGCVWIYDRDSISIVTDTARCRQLAQETKPPEVVRPTLHGTVVSAPTQFVSARARIAFRPEEPFSAGDVLVSEATDPDLIQHIRSASAVLTEQGGVTSHASILTRELGVPCIVGIADLLSSIKNDDLLDINLQTGEIINRGQQQSNVSHVAHLTAASVEAYGGKGCGLWKLHDLGMGSYLPQTYLVRAGFSYDNPADEAAIAMLSQALGSNHVAIRSSSSLEDGNSQSWAGQFPTFLNIENNVERIREKLHELLSWQASNDYASSAPLDGAHAMSAVVQEQVDSLYSGVCFTKCPVQNDPTKIIIELARGPGEELVSGRNIPYRIVYCKNKAEFIEVPEDGTYHPTINQRLLDLVSLAQKADQHWGKAVDIEFAIDQQYNLKLLQCRPITS